ncbi:unnamed protein product [Diatraea saccharalis]|uniref:SWIM-type domain-containing protein n=1 Tax=Diatraea saccharalis TaxID=40085 RepID=A0A9N9RH71_9NEOP|nr:unnamed protein product [Diatraea saccharalis]
MYSAWTVGKLKEELKRRGGSLRGRKADLIERLESYDKNFNFENVELLEDDDPGMVLSPNELYRDNNSNTSLPPLNKTHIRHYLSLSQLFSGSTFIRGICRKTMKNLHYEVNIKLDEHGIISEAHCECPPGSGNGATCKHVGVLLMGVEHMVRDKMFYYLRLALKNYNNFTPQEIRIQAHQSLVLNFPNSSMPMKQMYGPANPYALEVDHHYSAVAPKDQILKDLMLSTITEEQINYTETEQENSRNYN